MGGGEMAGAGGSNDVRDAAPDDGSIADEQRTSCAAQAPRRPGYMLDDAPTRHHRGQRRGGQRRCGALAARFLSGRFGLPTRHQRSLPGHLALPRCGSTPSVQLRQVPPDDDCGGHACGCRGGTFRVGEPYSPMALWGENTCFGGHSPRGRRLRRRRLLCSPSTNACGVDWGYDAFYCHTASDECIDDADCAGFDAGGGAINDPRFCAYDSAGDRWTCFRGRRGCPD